MQEEEVIIIGAGPCGLSAAIELGAKNINALVIEKESVVRSILHYPTYMNFFSTPDKLEIGDVPFTTANVNPTRHEALNYYYSVMQKHQLRVNVYEQVTGVTQEASGGFVVHTFTKDGETRVYHAQAVVVATGYFDHPNLLGIPGETLPKVSHFFREAHPYAGQNVVVIGGRNSAVEAALELQRTAAHVTIVYRGADYSPSIKPWVLPVLKSHVDGGRIQMIFGAQVEQIEQRSVNVRLADGSAAMIPNDFVLALTGFHPDRAFIQSMGVTIDAEGGYPTFDDATMETNVPGIYLAGVVSARHGANEIFIESGRFHGKQIADHLVSKWGR
jgi:thioredoxin reductase (NADPH)